GTAAPRVGIERNCFARRRLRSAHASAWLEFHGEQSLRYSDCSAIAWDPRIQSGCAGEALFRYRASQTFAKGELGAATTARADVEIRDGRRALFVATCSKIRGGTGTSSSPRLVPAILWACNRVGCRSARTHPG